MSVNLVESIKDVFNNEFVNKASTSLGENHGNIRKALGGIVPALLGGVLAKAHAGDDAGVFAMARNAAGSGGVASMLTANTDTLVSRGSDILSGLFGNKTNTVSNAIARYAGIKEPSANSLMGLSAPVVMGRLGEQAQEQNMNASQFTSFLTSQKDEILNALPSGLNLGSLLGLGSLASMGHRAASAAGSVRDRVTHESTRERVGREVEAVGGKTGTGWIWSVALLVLVAAAVWYFVARGKNKNEVVTTTATTTDNNAAMRERTAAGGNVSAGTKTATRVRLANGTELNAYAGGVEEKLVNCLNDATCKAGKDKWFDFDNINFQTGSANLTPESQQQVNNIVSILKAYPNTRIKIGGYTDKTGSEATNKRLSQQRAETVLNAIKSAGANASQLTGAEGYGSEFAKAPASASDAERMKDRRIAVQLQAK